MNHILYITSRCNLSCYYCYEKKKINDPNFKHFNLSERDMYGSIETAFKKDADPQFIIFGGEPTLYLTGCLFSLFCINQFSKARNSVTSVIISTNGTKPLEVQKILNFREKLQNINLFFEVSFDGIFHLLRRDNLHWKNTVKTIFLLNKSNILYNIRVSVLLEDLESDLYIKNLKFLIDHIPTNGKYVINKVYPKENREKYDDILRTKIDTIIKLFRGKICLDHFKYCGNICKDCIKITDERIYYSRKGSNFVKGDKYSFDF